MFSSRLYTIIFVKTPLVDARDSRAVVSRDDSSGSCSQVLWPFEVALYGVSSPGGEVRDPGVAHSGSQEVRQNPSSRGKSRSPPTAAPFSIHVPHRRRGWCSSRPASVSSWALVRLGVTLTSDGFIWCSMEHGRGPHGSCALTLTAPLLQQSCPQRGSGRKARSSAAH